MPAEYQSSLKNLITDPADLLQELNLDDEKLTEMQAAIQLFPLRVPQDFLNQISKGSTSDPLLRQVLPQLAETEERDGYIKDPLAEGNANPIPGLLHKYHGRVLVTLTSACAIHCRYCFRRHFPYEENNPGQSGWQKIYDYISEDTSIQEVILSGGDPLMLSDKLLIKFIQGLEKIQHIKILRFHTRIPIVLPSRMTSDFITLLKTMMLRFQLVMVVHCNHSAELSDAAVAVLKEIKNVGVQLLNQSVLLRGVNDDVEVLKELSLKLFENGVLPYYLHVLDKIAGTHHFDLPVADVKKIHKTLSTLLPGYLVPKLSQELPGQPNKTLLL